MVSCYIDRIECRDQVIEIKFIRVKPKQQESLRKLSVWSVPMILDCKVDSVKIYI